MKQIKAPVFLLCQIASELISASGENSQRLKSLGRELDRIIDAAPNHTGLMSPLYELASAGGRPIAVFDIESTGVDPVKSRIVELGVMRYHPDGTSDERSWLINPGCPIPGDASAAHGIGDEDVADKPIFGALVEEIRDYLEGCDLGTFNGNAYDIPMLNEHFAQMQIIWPALGTRQYDASEIYRKQHPRTLTAALAEYTGRDLTESAHRALADTEATAEVLAAQLESSTELRQMTPDELHAYCSRNPNQVDIAGKLVLNEDGEVVYNFGKDKGKVVRKNSGFAFWMLRNDFPLDTKNHINAIIKKYGL